MKLLQFIKEITDSEEEFLAVIEEMNRWISYEKNKRRSVFISNNISRFGFNRDIHRKALELTSSGWAECCQRSLSSSRERAKRQYSQAIQCRETNKYYRQNSSQHRENQSHGNSTLFWRTGS